MNNSNTTFTKVPSIGKTIFAIMSELAEQYNATDLSRGYPNFNCDTKLVDLVVNQLRSGKNQYAPVNGIIQLREEIAKKNELLYQAYYHPETEITISSGATEALYTAISTFVRENDEVIIFEPAYDSYTPAVQMNGGIAIYIVMDAPNYTIDWDQVQMSITANTKMIIINNPHNPTGKVLTPLDIKRLKKIVNGTNIIILADEVYEHIVFDTREHESLAKIPELKNRTIIVNSFGKTYHVTGWRLGYILAHKDLMKELRRVHQYKTYTANTPIQYAFAEYLKNDQSHLNVNKLLQNKRDLFLDLIKDTGLTFTPTEGTYFQQVSYANLSDESDFEFSTRLIREFGVASIPQSSFYKSKLDHKTIRFCFAKTDETLEEAADKLMKIRYL